MRCGAPEAPGLQNKDVVAEPDLAVRAGDAAQPDGGERIEKENEQRRERNDKADREEKAVGVERAEPANRERHGSATDAIMRAPPSCSAEAPASPRCRRQARCVPAARRSTVRLASRCASARRCRGIGP